MEPQKLKKIISLMYLDIITGDVHTRNQYMNTMITHIALYLRMEKLEPRQPAIEKFRTRLHNTILTILHNNHPLPAADTTREQEIRKLMKYFERFIIKVDTQVADVVGLDQMGVIDDIETLEYARNVCYSASSDYSNAMSGVPAGLTDASNKFAFVINRVTPIIYRYNMVEISESDFSNAARIAAKRLESVREMR
jgi:hypothetical protein